MIRIKTMIPIVAFGFSSLSAASQAEEISASQVSQYEDLILEDSESFLYGGNVNFNVNIDVLQIGHAISNAWYATQDRSAFVKNLMETVSHQPGVYGRYNVMVFNLGQNYHRDLNNVQFYASAKWQNLTFGIWVFESGTFINQSDGGYINWAFNGSWDRSGRDNKTVTFYSR